MPGVNWSNVQFFKPAEFTAPDRLNPILVYKLDDLRAFLGMPCVITADWANAGHSADSQHYLGNAIDCYFLDVPLLTQYLAAERFGFGGLGLYPDWSHPGLHLDVRDCSKQGYAARWGRIGNKYVELATALVYWMKRAALV